MGEPEIVSQQEWQKARDELLVAEKELTRAQDALAARRRRLPMVEFAGDYPFDTPDGPKTLLDLFEGRRQLAVYQFMDLGPDAFCGGCTWFTANVPATGLGMLADSGVTWTNASTMPLAQIEAYKERMGWTLPFVSSHGTTFARDCGVDGGFVLSLFLRDGDAVYRTYGTTRRGVDRLVFTNSILDLAPYGRTGRTHRRAGRRSRPTADGPRPARHPGGGRVSRCANQPSARGPHQAARSRPDRLTPTATGGPAPTARPRPPPAARPTNPPVHAPTARPRPAPTTARPDEPTLCPSWATTSATHDPTARTTAPATSHPRFSRSAVHRSTGDGPARHHAISGERPRKPADPTRQ